MQFKFISGLFLFVTCLMSGVVLNGQIKTPSASPSATLKQSVGLGEVTVEYSRPSKKDRVIFGGLVPYGEVWRTGANNSTKVTFSEDVKFGKVELTKGTYALYTVPSAKDWTVIFYKNTSLGGNLKLQDIKNEEIAARFEVPSTKMPGLGVETFTVTIDNLKDDGASIGLLWDDTMVDIPFTVNTDEKVMANINSAMAGPSGNDYIAAARYYYDSGKDLNKALEWMKVGIQKNGERFWLLRSQSLIEAKLGQYSQAISSAQRSMALAKEANNNDYIKMNTDSINEWTAKAGKK